MEEIKREPIIGLRKPITGLRKPITGLRVPIKLEDIADPNMTWDIQYTKLDNYVKYVAGQVVSGLPSAMMSAEDLYQEGLILLYNCFEKYRLKPEKDFQSLFKTSCWRLLRGYCYKKKEFQTVDLEEVYDVGFKDTSFNEMYDGIKLQQVKDALAGNELALKILEEAVSPSKESLWQAQMDFYRKETMKLQGKRSFSVTTIEMKPEFIRRALKVSKEEFNEAFRLLQSEVYAVYSLDTDIKSYQETDTLSDEEFNTYYKELSDVISKLNIA